ncbi:MAG: hypothetical protein JWL85_758 [Candidatus Saccharibacteria bacterium]|nr:hypothetical protein [Candidatus Saccharibacteria bacterium]
MLNKGTFGRIAKAAEALASVRPEVFYMYQSALSVDEVGVDSADEPLGVRSRIGGTTAGGQIDFVWLNEYGSDLLGSILADRGTTSPGKLLGYIEFRKQLDDRNYFTGELYLREYAEGESRQIDVSMQLRAADMDHNPDSEDETSHEFFSFAQGLGYGYIWRQVQQSEARDEQIYQGAIDARVGENLAVNLRRLLTSEPTRL